VPLKHDNLSNEEVKLNDPKRLDINHAGVLNISPGVKLNLNHPGVLNISPGVKLNLNHPGVLNISLSARFNSDPAALFGTVGKPRLFPNNINPWYNRQDGLFFPDQEESHAIFANLIDKKRYKRVPSMREKTKPFSRRSQAAGISK
jgi:hypothetical protein